AGAAVRVAVAAHAGAGRLRHLAGPGAGAGQRRGHLAGGRPAAGRGAGAFHAAAPVLRTDGAERGAVLPQPVPPWQRRRGAAAAAAAGLPAAGGGFRPPAVAAGAARRDARGDRPGAPAGTAGDRPGGRGSAGRRRPVDGGHRFHPGQSGTTRRRGARLRLPASHPVMPEDNRGFNLLTVRWLALGAAAGATLALVIERTGMEGPWQMAALVLALLALFATTTMAFGVNQRERQLQEQEERARRGAAEIDALQQEIGRHTQLEEELTRAKHAAESAVMAKGEFLATMSHEIRTPLNGIVPMLDLLSNSRLAPDQHELLRTATASAQQLLRIVDDIL